MDVSVILVSYNTKEVTKDCLNSIFKYTKDIEFEVFVIDNASTDGSVEMIEQNFPQVKLIKNSSNKGFGAANNIAIRQSNAKYVFCLNTDTLIIDNSIKQFFDFMEKKENLNIGVCGCQLLNEDKTKQHSGANFPKISALFLIDIGFSHFFPKIFEEKFYKIKGENNFEPYQIDYVTGADLFIRKSVLDKIGIFDEKFFMYFEETDLQYRMKKAGFLSFIIPTINIIHYCGFK